MKHVSMQITQKQRTDRDSLLRTMSIFTGQIGRLSICHAGTACGFVPNTPFLSKLRKTEFYHEEMEGAKFAKGIKEQLTLIFMLIVLLSWTMPHITVYKSTVSANAKKNRYDWLDCSSQGSSGPHNEQGELVHYITSINGKNLRSQSDKTATISLSLQANWNSMELCERVCCW